MLSSLYQMLWQVLVSFTCLIGMMIGLASAQQQDQQQQNQQAQPGSMGGIYRLSFFEFDVLTFREGKDHVFYQMTGFRGFDGGSGARNLSVDWNYEKMLLMGGDVDGHEKVESEVEQILHSLPPFSIEYIVPFQLGFAESAVSVMGGYTQTYLTDQSGKNPQKENNSAIYPLIRLRSHYYIFGGSVYLTGMPEPRSTDIFFGIGVMRIESTLRAGIRKTALLGDPVIWGDTYGLGGEAVSELSASQGTAFFQRAGLAVNGENYGFNLDFLFTGEAEVIDNPFAGGMGPIPQEDFDAFYMSTEVPERVHLRGVLMRAAITYTFY
ncbi:MAG: hypothetical protein HN867_08975 [Deltaproteobacteria bacterium]|jgi:hypothetical protein|nr:hypothetical protein [Deltaproteobacteria bacterium]MBT7203609.1 hypothetical protein [Deltaproteobacteria bacterium]